MAKEITREQADRKKQQAAGFMERIGEPDRADQFDDMSVEEYAQPGTRTNAESVLQT